MKTMKLLLAACAAMMCAGEAFAQETEKGVTINGVTWATRNVGLKGRFMDYPSDYGMFYSFNEAQSACPSGWRTPTKQELDLLAATTSEWTTLDGVPGRRFGRGDNSIFLPAAGWRETSGTVNFQGEFGYCWSSTSSGATSGSYLVFSSDVLRTDTNNSADGHNVRCVRD